MLSQLVVCRKAKLKFVYLKLMRMVELSTVVPPFLKAKKVQERVALTDANDTYSYKNLFENSKLFARKILNTYGQKHILNGDRIAFLCPNDISYTVVQWACWMAGAMVVPLCYDYPLNKIEFLVKDAQCSLIISSQECKDKGSLIASSSQILHFPIDKIDINNPNIKSKEDCDLESKWEEIDWSAKRAMLVYTSGTTGPPKGVVWTFKMLQAQNEMMISTWGISKSDCVLHTLPLHHVHGIVNALSCPLWAGASCFMMQEFDAEKVWQQLLENSKINVFHAVPTIYSILIQHYDGHFLSAEKRIKIREVLENKIRLMVSGSAALPDCIMNRWKEISGHTLLERYGMSEIGMALTNSLHGQRIPGAVGKPFPSVELQIKSLNGETLVEASFEKVIVKQGVTDLAGNLLVKGPSVFSEYWNQEKATLESFTDDGWFLTGDTAMYDQNNDVFRILGRTSVDIIKSGGYKISALDIERHLLEHPSVKEVAIVGLPDPTWGEIIAAVVALSSPLDFKDMQAWCSTKMPRHHIPRKIEIVDKIQRNAMGK